MRYKKTIIFLFSLLIGLAASLIIMKMLKWEGIKEAMLLLLSLKGISVLSVSLLAALASILRWKFILKELTGKREFKGLWQVWFVGFLFTYLLTPIAMLGGEPVRIYIINKLYKIKMRKNIASMIIDRLFDWTAFLVFTILGLFTFIFYGDFPKGKIGFFIISFVFFLSVLLLFFYIKSLKKESVLEWFIKSFGGKPEKMRNSRNGKLVLEGEKEIINFMSVNKAIFWKGFAFSFLKFTAFFIRSFLLIYFLGGGLNILKSFSINGLNNVSWISPVPAALGGMEATGVLSFESFGLKASSGIAFALASRGADVFLSLIGAVFLLKYTIKFTANKFLGKK